MLKVPKNVFLDWALAGEHVCLVTNVCDWYLCVTATLSQSIIGFSNQGRRIVHLKKNTHYVNFWMHMNANIETTYTFEIRELSVNFKSVACYFVQYLTLKKT